MKIGFALNFSGLRSARIMWINLLMLAFSHSGIAQQEILDRRWIQLTTPNFIIYSQVSNRKTEQVAVELESWRQVAADIVQGSEPFPKANVNNEVYLFDREEDLEYFKTGTEDAFFYPTPRSNFMAFLPDNESSKSQALHQYAHFLIRNNYDLRLPRWYEEGMSAYLSRLEFRRGEPRIARIDKDTYDLLLAVNGELSMERLLYSDAALASPRLIQIANLKSEALLHYFFHAWEESEFTDRRDELATYLEQLVAGRNQRFAFDQSFPLTTAQLDAEFENFLTNSRRPAATINSESRFVSGELEFAEVAAARLSLQLGELSLNTGGIENAEFFFRHTTQLDDSIARSYSGLGDALRFQEVEGRDQEIAKYFELALEREPTNPDILLDYGEYWETEMEDCDKTYPDAQRQLIAQQIKSNFEQALTLAPNNAEANLAMAEYYLLKEEEWSLGREYQTKAFELLPADGFIMEQTIKYEIANDNFEEAQRLIDEMAQPIHFFGEPDYVTDLRERLMRKRRGENYDACAK